MTAVAYFITFAVRIAVHFHREELTSMRARLQMILEVAVLDVIPEKVLEFEASFKQASKIISSIKGYISHELKKCIEKPNRYILLVNWESLEDHTKGFRQSPQYAEWKALLHHFYDPFPTVEHYHNVT